MTLQMQTPVKFVKRIGARIAEGLHDRGIETIEDLLYHLPFRYEDRLHPKPLSAYRPGEMASILGEVRGTVLLRTRSGPIFEMTVGVAPLRQAADQERTGAPGPGSPASSLAGVEAPDSRTRVSSTPTHPLSSRPEAPNATVTLSSRPEAPNATVTLSSRPEAAGRSGETPEFPAPARGPGQSAKGATHTSLGLPASAGFPAEAGSPRKALENEARAEGPTQNEPPMDGLLRPPPTFETIKCLWFHGTYLKDKFRPGQRIALYGKLEGSRSGNALNAPPGSTKFKMVQPTFEILPDANSTGEDAEFTTLEMGRIVPVYPSLGGTTPWGSKLSSRWLRRVLWTIFRDLKALRETAETAHPPGAPFMTTASPSSWVGSEETLPQSLLDRLGLPSRMDALESIHFPAAGTPLPELQSARTPAHRRLIFEELFYLELGLELKRRRLREREGTAFVTNDQVRKALKQILPFKPTNAQKRVLGEIVADMRAPRPMRRLLQGDVGSGKTIVALEAALVAIENGYQVALMAPTEILATQHFLSARKLLRDAISPSKNRPYRITLLTGSLDDRTKRDARARIFTGETDLAIGTHALVEEKVDFDNLGLVIVDEQHRFGVQQRFKLMRKPRSTTALSSRPDGQPASNSSSRPDAQPASNSSSRPDAQPTSNLSSRPEALSEPQASRTGRSGETPVFPASGATAAYADPGVPGGRSSSAGVAEPDVLVMTATPIPRTLALTIYGDLEASILDELPPGRTPITTRRMPEERAAEVWDFVRKQVQQGRQAYIVYPIIEGERDDQPELDFAQDPSDANAPGAPRLDSETWASRAKRARELPKQATLSPKPGPAAKRTRSSPPRSSKLNATPGPSPLALGPASPAPGPARRSRAHLRSASEMFDELSAGALHGLKLGLLHGRMSADDKEVTMARFQRGEIDVLVSTTVIEVGVDVPNATVMVIEHAERFGLAQLHQLRGRVGRGAAKSFCVLLTGRKISPEAELRLDAMVQTQDGFALAEIDLAQRGPGEFFGTRQAGLPEFRVANLARDRDLLDLAKTEAARFVESPDPAISREERDAVWARLKRQWQRRYGLVEA